MNPKLSSRSNRALQLLVILVGLMAVVSKSQAQIDPAHREILHMGANASLTDPGPLGAYGFFYWNMPDVPTTNEVLRLAIAPIYVNGELGFKGLLGQQTDLGVGAFGGLYAENYSEVDAGRLYKNQSFQGDDVGANVSVYHRVNPDQMIPLTAVLRETVDYQSFQRDGNTAGNFIVPANQPIFTTRVGFRWGGREPVLGPKLAMEVSAWYELEHRADDGGYGFSNDRRLEPTTQRFFGRAQFNYLTLETKDYIVFGLQGGGSSSADRMSCYRMGGVLQYASEFPLNIPGYYSGELSARDYGLVYGAYAISLGEEKHWFILTQAAAALVDYVDGTGQPGAFNSGVGIGPGYQSSGSRWKAYTLFGYGFEAERQNGRGGYSIAIAFDYNFGAFKLASDEAYKQLEEAEESGPSISR